MERPCIPEFNSQHYTISIMNNLLSPMSASLRALACPRREPEPLAEVAAGSRTPNENTVGGGLRGATRHGPGGVSTAWGRRRGLRLLRRKPGPEAVAAGVAVCRSPARRRRPWRGPAAAVAADPGPARFPPSTGRGRPAFAPEPAPAPAPRGYQSDRQRWGTLLRAACRPAPSSEGMRTRGWSPTARTRTSAVRTLAAICSTSATGKTSTVSGAGLGLSLPSLQDLEPCCSTAPGWTGRGWWKFCWLWPGRSSRSREGV